MRIEIIFIIILTILLILGLLTGCGVTEIPIVPISSLQKNIIDIKESNTIIKNNTKLPIILASSKDISISAGRIEKNIKSIEKGLVKVIEERDQAIEDRDSALHKGLQWLILASIVGAGALGVFGFMYSSKACLTLSAVCIVIMSVAIFVETFFIYLVIGGSIILIGLVGMVIYNIVINRKAFSEIVQSVELIKGKNYKDIMNGVQSKRTRLLVDKEKQIYK